MPKHRPSTSTAILDRDDYGHAFVRRNARIVPQARLEAAQGMELADIADIDHPDRRGASVRVARRIDPLIAILDLTHDGPGRAQFLACEEFRRHSAIANGIKPMNWLSFCQVQPDGQTPAQLLLDAQRKVRQAWLAIRGPENNALIADVVRLVVLGQMTLQVVDMSRRCRHGTSRELLDVGLQRLTEHYGLA
jgi:hypothetical protein